MYDEAQDSEEEEWACTCGKKWSFTATFDLVSPMHYWQEWMPHPPAWRNGKGEKLLSLAKSILDCLLKSGHIQNLSRMLH